MPTEAEKRLLKVMKAKHIQRYDAPVGKRRCTFQISKDCVKVGREYDKDGKLLWKGRMCKKCLREKFQIRYAAIIEAQGGPRPIGRPRKVVDSDEE